MERNIDSRDEILKKWNTQASILNSVRTVQHRVNVQREKQILNKKMDAWIRAMDERNFVTTDDLIKTKATELMKLHNLSNFVPDPDWISSIREKYNLKKEEDQSSDALESDKSFSENANSLNRKICRKKLRVYGRNRKSHLEPMHPEELKTEEMHQDEPPTSTSEADVPRCSKRFAADAEEMSNYRKSNSPRPRTEVLSLHAKVSAIRLYDKYPVCRNVARHFQCTAQYIQRIIESRDEILEEWNKQTINEQEIVLVGHVSPAQHRKITQREMKILNNHIDGWIRGCMDDPNFVATDELLQAKAIELIRHYNLKIIVPDDEWISSVRNKYELKNEDDPSTDAPEADGSSNQEDNSLEAEDEDISEHNHLPRTSIIDTLSRPSTWMKRRMLKLELLNDCMFEWVLRMQAKGNGHQLNRDLIIQTAQEASKHVKVPNLKPRWNWFNKFRLKYNLTTVNLKTRRLYQLCGERKDHLPLEFPDIIDFVKRKTNWTGSMQQTVTESHRYQIAYTNSRWGEVVEDVVPVREGACSSQTSQKVGAIADGVVVTFEEVDGDVDDIVPVKFEEGVDDDVPVKCEEVFEIVDDIVPVKCEEVVGDDVPVECEKDVEIVEGNEPMDDDLVDEDLDDDVPVKCEEGVDDDVPVKCEEILEIVDDIVPVKCEEDLDDDVPVKCEEDVEDDVPMKGEEDIEIIEGIDPVDGDDVDVDDVDEEKYEPRKLKGVETHNPGNTKRFIKTDEDALRYLKALDNFVLLEENFRAIGVISQLEALFRNP